MKDSKKIKNFIILGPQGAGKGTQAQLLAREFNLEWIETGRLLREKAGDGTDLGEKIGGLQDQGVLVPDDVVTQLIKEKIKEASESRGIILDGYPRNIRQLENLEEILGETNRAEYQAIFVDISKEVTLERLAGRKTCSKCGKIFSKTASEVCDACGGKLIVRADDRPEAIEKRLEVYHKETEPILRFYREKGVLIEVNGEELVEKVYRDIVKNLRTKGQRNIRMIFIKTPEEIQIMREGGKILARILKELAKSAKVGVKTEELDELAEKLTKKYNAKPSFKSYQGYPKSLCISINEELVHCLPSKREIKEGDIVSLDFGIWYKGLCTDTAVTFGIGRINSEAKRIINITKKALYIGIKQVRSGAHIGDIGSAIQKYVESKGFSVVRDLSGHGVGKAVHEPPQILHYGKPGAGKKLEEGMTICIEPMACVGDYKIKQRKDGSFVTLDGSLSAHFEHTILVTKRGYEILT